MVEKTKKSKAENKDMKKEKKTAEKPKQAQPEVIAIEPFRTIKFVIMTEKAIQLIERQNKLVFVVDRGATKNEIKKAVEGAFSAGVKHVNTMIDQSGRKKAFVRFAKPGEAGEIAIKLGII